MSKEMETINEVNEEVVEVNEVEYASMGFALKSIGYHTYNNTIGRVIHPRTRFGKAVRNGIIGTTLATLVGGGILTVVGAKNKEVEEEFESDIIDGETTENEDGSITFEPNEE